MRLQILRIIDRGVANKERVHIAVLESADLSYYTVLLSRYVAASGIANGNLAAFWFPSQSVQPGDNVILFSGFGTPSSRHEANGSTTYFYYWGHPKTVWNHPANCVALVEAAGWVTSPQGG